VENQQISPFSHKKQSNPDTGFPEWKAYKIGNKADKPTIRQNNAKQKAHNRGNIF
jgi:hypothetical protein